MQASCRYIQDKDGDVSRQVPLYKCICEAQTVTYIHVCANLFQMFDSISSTYTYLIGDTKTREAIIIDPVYEQVQRDVQEVHDLDLNLIYASK